MKPIPMDAVAECVSRKGENHNEKEVFSASACIGYVPVFLLSGLHCFNTKFRRTDTKYGRAMDAGKEESVIYSDK